MTSSVGRRRKSTRHQDPLERNTDAEHGKQSTAVDQASLGQQQKRFIDLYDPDVTIVRINVPVSSLEYVPSSECRERQQQPPFVMCRRFMKTGHCSDGNKCRFVHGIMGPELPPPQPVHANIPYASLEQSRYPTVSAGKTLSIVGPNGRPPASEVPSYLIIQTQGSSSAACVTPAEGEKVSKEGQCSDRQDGAAAKPLSHCAHYYFNRVCNRGATCAFIHVVSVDQRNESDSNGSSNSAFHFPSQGILLNRAFDPKLLLTEQGSIEVVEEYQLIAVPSEEVPIIEISRASPVEKESLVSLHNLGSPTPPNEPSSLRVIQPNVSQTPEYVPDVPLSLQGSFADSKETPSSCDDFTDQPTRLSPASSRQATPRRTDSFSTKSPKLRAVTIGCKTLLFPALTPPQPKDKDGCSPPPAADGSDADASSSAATTPIGFRHHPYGGSGTGTPTGL